MLSLMLLLYVALSIKFENFLIWQVISRMQFLAASFRGINDFASDRMKSHNVHSEIVFSFSPNNNVRILL